jgi:hypothetical protein
MSLKKGEDPTRPGDEAMAASMKLLSKPFVGQAHLAM